MANECLVCGAKALGPTLHYPTCLRCGCRVEPGSGDAGELRVGVPRNADHELLKRVDEAASAYSALVLDLSQVTEFLPSMALAKLVSMHRKRRATQQELRLVGVQPLLMEVFRVLRLDGVLCIVDPPPE